MHSGIHKPLAKLTGSFYFQYLIKKYFHFPDAEFFIKIVQI